MLDTVYADLVGRTKPDDNNRYLIEGLPKHITFKEVVEAI